MQLRDALTSFRARRSFGQPVTFFTAHVALSVGGPRRPGRMVFISDNIGAAAVAGERLRRVRSPFASLRPGTHTIAPLFAGSTNNRRPARLHR